MAIVYYLKIAVPRFISSKIITSNIILKMLQEQYKNKHQCFPMYQLWWETKTCLFYYAPFIDVFHYSIYFANIIIFQGSIQKENRAAW